MAQMLARSSLHSSQLTRTLAHMGALTSVGSGLDLAQTLGQWTSVTGAISLSSVLGQGDGVALEKGHGTQTGCLDQEFSKVRSALLQSMTRADRTGVQSAGTLPEPERGTSLDDGILYAPYRRYHQARQRDMEAQIGPLRRKVREALHGASPTLRCLAALDACYEQILGETQARLLATVPTLLEKRFRQLLRAHQHKLKELEQEDRNELWLQPDGWLTQFRNELQTVLLAELDLRLAPTIGLLEAFHSEARIEK
jgi:hypothetical protein